MTEALINPEMLRWARERSGLTVAGLAAKLKIPQEKLTAWEGGVSRPTFRSAEKLAHTVHLPFGFLFLSDPPQETLPIPDFRASASQFLEGPSLELRDLLQDVLFKLDWYKEYRLEHGASPLPFVGRFKVGDAVEEIAGDIRQSLQLDALAMSGSDLSALFERCEEIGIWIMCSGTMGGNTHRPLSVQEFRGFAVCDPVVPLIFINGRDAKAAQAFTLAHELAHLWLGQSGISNPSLVPDKTQTHRVEVFCNKIAAEVLVPRGVFLSAWNAGESLETNAALLSQQFRVSPVVIARRALELRKIPSDRFQAFFDLEKRRWEQIKEERGGGGNYYFTTAVRNGKKYTQAVLHTALSGNLLLRDAGTLLNMSPANLHKLHDARKRK